MANYRLDDFVAQIGRVFLTLRQIRVLIFFKLLPLLL
jgi:hypothetical protein